MNIHLNPINQDKERKLLQLKCQYNELTSSKITSSLMWLNQSYYDHYDFIFAIEPLAMAIRQ